MTSHHESGTQEYASQQRMEQLKYCLKTNLKRFSRFGNVSFANTFWNVFQNGCVSLHICLLFIGQGGYEQVVPICCKNIFKIQK